MPIEPTPVLKCTTCISEATGIAFKEDWKRFSGVGDFAIHRTDGPASIERHHETGVMITEEWWQDNAFHRDDGPAVTYRTPEGHVYNEEWWYRGARHREDGPAVIERDRKTGEITRQQWWINGDHDKKRTKEMRVAFAEVLKTTGPQPG